MQVHKSSSAHVRAQCVCHTHTTNTQPPHAQPPTQVHERSEALLEARRRSASPPRHRSYERPYTYAYAGLSQASSPRPPPPPPATWQQHLHEYSPARRLVLVHAID